MLILVLCTTFILTLVNSGNLALLLENDSSSPKLAASNEKINLTLVSEGGTVVASSPDLLPTKTKQLTNLLRLDEELETHKEASIKARKGVDNTTNLSDNIKTAQNSTMTQIIVNSKNESLQPSTNNIIANVNGMHSNRTLNISKPTSPIEIPKKPLILSYEALVNADKNNQDELKIPATNPTSKTLPNLLKNQIPSPNEGNIVKVYPSKANSHPGMIMPIVITILVVPMFAIVGYMALKRGKEAWKNRHYKRMDFLLDGMYND